ncbi:MAG: hypothetical protein JSV08_06315 [Acidobacteriota bacterium]|nr:MAG: hypothetical protein JSV08_06315 [Acidobacteriota bacterium]
MENRKQRCPRRWSTAVALGLWYLLFSTNAVFLAFDWIAPPAKPTAEAGSLCANLGCGCDAEQCAVQCCCFPELSKPSDPAPSDGTGKQRSEPGVSKASYLSAAACSGQLDGAASGKKNYSHTLAAVSFLVFLPDTEKLIFPEENTLPYVFADPIDKVPRPFSRNQAINT